MAPDRTEAVTASFWSGNDRGIAYPPLLGELVTPRQEYPALQVLEGLWTPLSVETPAAASTSLGVSVLVAETAACSVFCPPLPWLYHQRLPVTARESLGLWDSCRRGCLLSPPCVQALEVFWFWT